MEAPPKLDRLERVTDLVLVLLETQQPLTLDAIAHQVPGYPAEHSARRQAFERDKRLLRDEGIPVRTERLPGNEQYGYLIDRDSFYLPDLDLEADEQVALHLAVAGVHLGDPSGRDALLKLGAAGLGDVRPIAAMVPPAALIELFEAVRSRAVASFSYRGEPRQVVPVGLWFRFGHWYLVAYDLDREAQRTFRVDRIDGEVTRRESTSTTALPDDVEIDVEAALPDEPWDTDDDDRVDVRIRVDAVVARRVADEVGQDKVVARHDDGSIDVVLEVSSFFSIRSWLLGLLDHAVMVDPSAFRDEMVAWLEALVSAVPAAAPPAAAAVGNAASDANAASDDGATYSKIARSTVPSPEPAAVRSAPGAETSRRLRRLLAVVGWLAQVGEAPVADIAQRFGMSEKELVAELELAACCGTPPYTPDTLMEIEVSEHSVRAFLPPEYARPRRLTPAEGFAVGASARLLLAVPGSDDDALRRALAKLESALGAREAVGLDVDAPADLPLIRAATGAGRSLELEYLSASRDELTTRVVEPMQVITVDGHWYLDAYCHRAGDMRRFRVDRIVKARQLDQPVSDEVRRPRPAEDMFVPGPGAYEVHLALGPGAGWVAESIPVRQVRRDDDGTVTDLVMDVAGLAWFERLLLQLGPATRVVSPPELTGLVGEAARRVLERYDR